MNKEDKGIINDDAIFNYLEGSMPGKTRQELEREAYTTGELNDMYIMEKSVYNAHSEQADELLGQDITCSEEMQHVFNEAERLRRDKPVDVTMTEYLQAFLQEQLSISRSESEQRLQQIIGGVEIYYSSYDQQVASGGDSYIPVIESVMSDLPQAKRIDYLTNVYVLLLAFNGKINKDSINSVREQIEHSTIESEDATSSTEKLLERIKVELDSATLPGDLINEESLERLKEDFSVNALLDSRRLDKEYAIYSAVCAYVSQSKGEIQITNDSAHDGVNPVAIGIGVASGIKQSELTQQYLSGELEESKFIKFLKIAACVAAFALAIYLAIHFAGPIIGELLQYLAIDPSLGFWWNALNVAMLTMFFASLALNVLLQGAFMAFILYLIIEAVNEWVSSKRQVASESVASTTSQTEDPSVSSRDPDIITPNNQDGTIIDPSPDPVIEL